MSSISSLEVARSVEIVSDELEFVDVISSLGREIFDTRSNGIVSLRPGNKAFRTTKPGMRVFEWFEYVHFSRVGKNVRRLGKKMHISASIFEGDRSRVMPRLYAGAGEQQACVGFEPLKDTYERIASKNYGINLAAERYSLLGLFDIVALEYPARYPAQTIFCLKSDADFSIEADMLASMSRTAETALSRHRVSSKVLELAGGPTVDTIPFASTRNTDENKITSFIESVRELLPLSALLQPTIEISQKNSTLTEVN